VLICHPFPFGAFPNRLDQQLMVEIASPLLMAVEADAAVIQKKSLTEWKNSIYSTFL